MNDLRLLNIDDNTAVFLVENYNINLVKKYGVYSIDDKDYSRVLVALEEYLENNKQLVKKLG